MEVYALHIIYWTGTHKDYTTYFFNTEEECNAYYELKIKETGKVNKDLTYKVTYITGCIMSSNGYCNALRSHKF